MKLKKDWIHDLDEIEFDNTYSYWFICDNCDKRVNILVRKGVEVPREVLCKNCECLSKVI